MNRESRIVEHLEKHRFVTTSMLRREFFPCKSGERIAQRVLKRMVDRGMIERTRFSSTEEYIYHLGWSAKWNHWLSLNRFHYQLLGELSSWHKVLKYEFEVSYGPGIADGFYCVRTTIDGKGRKFFVEIDDDRNNPWDKTEKYQTARQGDWQSEWWADPLNTGRKSFPLVVVWTVRPEQIPTGEGVRVIPMGEKILANVIKK